MNIAYNHQGLGRYRVIEHGDFVEVELLVSKLTDEVCEAMLGDVEDRGWARLLLECSRVRFLSSLGLGALIRLDRRLRPAGGRLRLVGLLADLRELFEITRINRVIQIRDDRFEAVTRAW